MSDSLTQQQRELLRGLAAMTSFRARREAEIGNALRDAIDDAEREWSSSVADAESVLARLQRSIESEYRSTLVRAQGRHDAEREKASAAKEHAIRQFSIQTNAMETDAIEKAEEKTWLAETVQESSVKKARQDFEQTRSGLEAKSKELAGIEAQAQLLLRKLGHRPMPEVPRDESTISGPAAAQLDEAGAAAVRLLEHLHRRLRPLATSVGFVLGACALTTAAGGIASGLLLKPTSPAGIAYGAAGALGATLLILFVTRVMLRTRVAPAARSLADALSKAAAAGKKTLRDAEQDRDASFQAAKARRDGELALARERLSAAKKVIAERREVEEPALVSGHDRELARIDATLDREQQQAERARDAKLSDATRAREGTRARATDAREQAKSAAHQREAVERDAMVREFSVGLSASQTRAQRISSECRSLCPDWDDAAWTHWKPRVDVPRVISIGRFDVDLHTLPGGLPEWHGAYTSKEHATLVQPLLLDFLDRGSLLLQHGQEGRGPALATLNNTMLRLLTTFPPAKVRFTIIDPIGLGQSFAAFMHLADHHELLISDRIWTEPRHIEQKLGELTEHMETVIQKYLRNEFQTIQEYNAQAGEVAEPYRFLVIADFPANLTEQATKRLASIVSSGPRCGVFTLVSHDTRAKLPGWLPLSDLQRAAIFLRYESGRFVRQDEDFAAFPISVEEPPPEETITRLLHDVGRAAKELGRVRVPFELVAPPPEAEWSLDTAEQVQIPLGRAGATKLQYLTLGQGTAQHALIAGRTGSGKSTLLHVIITNLGLWCGPDQVEMYLVDFKKGVEFKAYATHELPHARVIAVESEREFGLSVLRRLDGELTYRGQLFRELGVQDLAGYRRVMKQRRTQGVAAAEASDGRPSDFPRSMPRVMLIVDEFQEFFVEDDKLSQEAALLLDRLVRQGRAFGMHVILGSQTLGGAYSLARSTLGQMAVRIALQCSEADSYLIMAEDNNAPRLLNRPGEAIYNDASGMLEGNSPFQIVWLPEETRERKLAEVRAKLAQSTSPAPPPAIVFEGNVPADITRSHELNLLLRDSSGMASNTSPRAWLGDAVSIKDPTHMLFRRQSASNLLIVGQQEDSALTLLVSSLISLAAHTPLQPQFLVLDSTPADSPHASTLLSITQGLSRPDLPPGVPPFAGVRQAAAAVTALGEELTARERSGTNDAPPLFLIVMGLHRFRDLRKTDDFSFGGDNDKPAADKVLARLLRDGPAMGIHTIAWIDTAANVDRTLDRQSTREFEARVLYQMSANDSTALIDSPSAANLGRYRALLYREELGTLEKFRPFAMPSQRWISQALEDLAAGASPTRPTQA